MSYTTCSVIHTWRQCKQNLPQRCVSVIVGSVLRAGSVVVRAERSFWHVITWLPSTEEREREMWKCELAGCVFFFFWPKTDNCCRVTVNMWFPRNHSEWVWPVLEPIGKFGVFQKKGLLLISQKHEWPTVVREEIFHRWFYGMLFFFFFFYTVTLLNLKCSFINFNHKYFYSFLGNNFVWLFRKVFSFNTFLLVTLWQSFCFCFLFCFLKLLFMLLLLWEAKLQLFS